MKREANRYRISTESIAAFMDGNASVEESQDILSAIAQDDELKELLDISLAVDADLDENENELLPITSLAASCEESHYCCLECEKFILDKHHISFNEADLIKNSTTHKWLKKNGTALFNMGRHLECFGLVVTRKYHTSFNELCKALDKGLDLIVAIDGNELKGDPLHEHLKDLVEGETPNHAVVVLSCDPELQQICIYDPNSSQSSDIYSWNEFDRAWTDSKHYSVAVDTHNWENYEPCPIDLTDVELSDDLDELREAIAENAHEIWAQNRKAEGWSYGPCRNDELKQTPDMVPYSALPEEEKKYDREMAMQTIKLLKKIGYDLIKVQPTEWFQQLSSHLRNTKKLYRCAHCGNVLYKRQKFCDCCGHKIEQKWES